MTDREKAARLHRLLRQRHLGGSARNGDAWAFFTEVRNGTGFTRRRDRTADAIAMSLWPSRGLEIHGFEVKVSRTDWLRELRDPSKSDDFVRFCDRWWLVVEPEIVEKGELPPTWGLLVRRGGKLRVEHQAPKLEAEDITRLFLASLLRAAGRRAEVEPAQITEARQAGAESERQLLEPRIELEREQADGLRSQIDAFEKASGMRLSNSFPGNYSAADVGAAVKLTLEGKARTQAIESRLRHLADNADSIAEQARQALPDKELRAA